MTALDEALRGTQPGGGGSSRKQHHRNPRAGLGATTPLDRARAHEMRLLTWLAQWGYTSRAIAMHMVGRKATAILRRLEGRHLVRAVAVETLRDGYVWMLRPDGFAIAQSTLTRSFSYEFAPEKCVKSSYVRHHLATQHVVMSYDPVEFYPHIPWLDAVVSGEKQPDCEMTMRDETSVALEIELTQKHGRELDMALIGASRFVEFSRSHFCIYVSHSRALLDNYRAHLENRHGVQHWTRQGHGAARVWVPDRIEHIPRDFIERFDWRHLPTLFEQVL
ncbi:MAG TPA: hypothetical protein VFA75_05335 [Nevskia sp.]|nr:hypothetical protein [Nevskia sp.]